MVDLLSSGWMIVTCSYLDFGRVIPGGRRLPGSDAKLSEQSCHVEYAPALDELAFFNLQKRHPAECNLLARLRDPHKSTAMGSGTAETNRDPITFRENLFQGVVDIRKRRPEHGNGSLVSVADRAGLPAGGCDLRSSPRTAHRLTERFPLFQTSSKK